MPFVSNTDFVTALRTGRLLEPAQMEQVGCDLEKRFPEPRALARELINRDWLTPFQVNQLFQGRASDLVLGQYVLLERLGEGGMGAVFKARHQTLDRIVAVKVIRKERLASPLMAKRFLREVQLAAQLSHPNIVLAFDADQVGSAAFLVMEYVDGIDLGRVVKQSGPMPVHEVCDALRQAALGLQHALERGLIHRDIKPSNLLRTNKGGVVKVLDMGLARLEEDDDGAMLTLEGTIVGTPDFIAPEQAM